MGLQGLHCSTAVVSAALAVLLAHPPRQITACGAVPEPGLRIVRAPSARL